MREHRSLVEMIPELTWGTLKEAGISIKKKKNQLILDEQEEALWIIVKGHAVILRSSRYAEERMIFICGAGEILNETAVENGSSAIKARTLDDCELLKIEREKMLELMDRNPELTQAVFYSAARKMRRLYHQTGNNSGTYTLEEHLKVKLWKLAKDYGSDTPQGRKVDFDVSVIFLASMLGAKRETVSRIVSKFREQGILSLERGQLIVKDMEQLRTMF